MQKWEYKVDKLYMEGKIDPNIDFYLLKDGDLDEIGEEGWELVSVVPMHRGGGLTVAEYFIFKRPLE